jgi:hypothetical protein
MKLSRVETWVWEQAVLVVLLAVAGWQQLVGLAERGELTAFTVTAVAGSAFAVFAAHKVRSRADRQAEQDKLAGVERAPMRCAASVREWAAAAESFAILTTAWAPTAAHAAVALYVAGYPFWRKLYRRWKPAVLEGVAAGGRAS